MSGARKNKKRNQSISREETIQLIEEVKSRPEIWDLTNKNHSNNNAVRSAWAAVSAATNKEVDEVKSTWLSLRDSLRYHTKKKATQILKSGSAGGSKNINLVESEKTGPEIDWEMAEHMSFLQGLSHKRKTFASVHAPSTSEKRGCDSPEEDTEEASYDYRPKKKKNSDPIGTEIGELLKSAKDLISVVQTKQDNKTTGSLKNVEMFSFWDKMMEDFSEEALQQVQAALFCHGTAPAFEFI
ncbi:uncharacterized protein [Drosophila takahashii]|uniref:uncharacterized protein isoform X2 n=1 Tax=Drosophila takahashii TaxID=29030 RepID=UPI00389924CD